MIPLSVPCIEGNEWKYIKDCLDTNWISSVGSYVNRFEEALAQFTGAKYAVCTVNGTAALHISLELMGVGAGDLVILPNITFVASANSIAYTGAEPLLIDIDETTWQMDLSLLEEYLKNETFQKEGNLFDKVSNKRIAAIMPVHVLGNMGDIEKLCAIAATYNIPVVEDSTEALGSYYNKKHAGTFGTLGCFSFNGNKIISTGGGGMIVTNDEKLAKRAKHLTTQAKADPNEYFHDETGYNYRLVNVLAAMGVAQMEKLPEFLQRKANTDAFYKKALQGFNDIRFQQISPNCNPNHWLFTIRTQHQKEWIEKLRADKIEVRPFWVPMNQLPMYTNTRYISQNQISQKIYSECLSLPCSSGIKQTELETVVQKIKSI